MVIPYIYWNMQCINYVIQQQMYLIYWQFNAFSVIAVSHILMYNNILWLPKKEKI